MLIPIILAGGKGKRLYPISTEKDPKQFKRIFSENSMLQNTILRLDKSLYKEPIILSNSKYLPLLLEQLNEIGCLKYNLMLEKEPLGTAIAIAISLLMLPEESSIAILPSDHHITNAHQFESTIRKAVQNLGDKIIILSTEVKYSSSDYGYLTTDKKLSELMKVIAFREKPKSMIFNTFYSHFWNTGIVLSTVKTMLQEFNRIDPELIETASMHLEHKEQIGPSIWNLPYLTKNSFKSVDEVVMQNSENIYTIYMHSNWYDFGSLVSIFDYIKNEYKDLNSYQTFDRAWGNYKILFKNKNFCIKHLCVYPNSALSLQYHEHRDECLQVFAGEIFLLLGGRKKYLKKNEILVIEKFVHHQIINQSANMVEMFEIQHGEVIDEGDVIRLNN